MELLFQDRRGVAGEDLNLPVVPLGLIAVDADDDFRAPVDPGLPPCRRRCATPP